MRDKKDLQLNFPSEEKQETWRGYDFSKPSKCVVCYNGNEGCILFYVGAGITFEIEEVGLGSLDDFRFFPDKPGIFIWEGKFAWQDGTYECPLDGYSKPVGKFRKPTDKEFKKIKNGENPWNDEEYKLK
jgi:hypothetical protein